MIKKGNGQGGECMTNIKKKGREYEKGKKREDEEGQK